MDSKLAEAIATVKAATTKPGTSGLNVSFVNDPDPSLDRVRICDMGVDNRRGGAGSRVARRGPDGKTRIERRPSRPCNVRPGGPVDPETPLSSDDWVEPVIDHHGHEIFQPLSSSSARVATKKRFVVDGMHQRALDKRLRFGWIPVARCLVDVLDNEEVTPRSLLVSLDGEEPCAKGSYTEYAPCKHVVAERDARRAKNAAAMAALEARNKPVDRDAELAIIIAKTIAESLPQSKGKR